jgi:UDP-N-acetylglucosamine--N-acetylmuramyl-(pentapeptide) pyrophosphoryl-undecaprenol N-acetylglucosamine transferase
LVVLGGSGGAQSLNEHAAAAIAKLRGQLGDWQIIHQSGSRACEATRARYQKLALAATVVPFVQNLGQVLRFSDLAVCRAGGTTLAELAATGVPAVLVPYPYATDDHQRLNAEVFLAVGAARMVDERTCEESLDIEMARTLDDLVADAARRRAMSQAMLGLARPDAAWQVARMVLDVACDGIVG